MAVITEEEGDIFDAPPNSVLIQACNAKGVWGKGIARGFKTGFLTAHRAYKEYCNTKPSKPKKLTLPKYQHSLLGKCFITSIGHEQDANIPRGSYYHIVSLITCNGFGKKQTKPPQILQNTANAIRDLETQIALLKKEGLPVGNLFAPRINEGKFKVPWEDTKKVLEQGNMDMRIVTPPPGQQTPANQRKAPPKDCFVWEDGNLSDYSEHGAAILVEAELAAPRLRPGRAKHGRSLLDEV